MFFIEKRGYIDWLTIMDGLPIVLNYIKEIVMNLEYCLEKVKNQLPSVHGKIDVLHKCWVSLIANRFRELRCLECL